MSNFLTGIAKYVDSHLKNSSEHEESISTNENTDNILKESNKNMDENKNKNGIRVENGKIQVKKSGNIIPCVGIELYINGDKCRSLNTYSVNERDKIEWNLVNSESNREISICTSKDKMKAFVNILYTKPNGMHLKDTEWSENLYLQCEAEYDEDTLERYNMFDVKDLLKQNNITKGIDESKLKEACKSGTGGQNVEVAQGVMPVDDIPSTLDILFDIGEKHLNVDSADQKIDYKNVYSIVNVNEGDVLAKIIPLIDGTDGYNVFGEEIKRKIAKKTPIKIGKGCKIVNNKIIVTQDGRPSSKNGVISVNSVYKVKNVDIKSGNIKFIGDIEIEENVSEGMTVNAGNSIVINKGVDNAVISAGGEINIKGNIINSKVTTGQIDIEKKIYLDNLKKIRTDIEDLIECSEELLKRTDMHMNFSEVVKVLIENKFKSLSDIVPKLVETSTSVEAEDHETITFLKNNLIGANISNIKHENQLKELLKIIDKEIDFFEDDMIIQSDINISYCLDSLIKSTGKIQISGQGTYVSDIIALNEVEFVNKNSVARGGKISSMKSVALGIVGSTAGVRTVIEVPESGVITAEKAYMNTCLLFGKKSKIIDSDCRNLKAYINEFGDIEIEKFNL